MNGEKISEESATDALASILGKNAALFWNIWALERRLFEDGQRVNVERYF